MISATMTDLPSSMFGFASDLFGPTPPVVSPIFKAFPNPLSPGWISMYVYTIHTETRVNKNLNLRGK